MPSYVIVWENNTLGHSKVSGKTWPGHSAINIGDQFYDRDTPTPDYVSYWPGGDGAGFTALGALLTPKQKSATNMSLLADIEAEGYFPDHVIELPTDKGKEDRMRAGWKAVFQGKKDGPSYRALRKNCSTICSRVLHAGGFYGKKWAVNNNWAWSPADIKTLAVSAGGRPMKWPEFLAVLKKSYITLADCDLTDSQGRPIAAARSGKYCSTGAPVKFQGTGYTTAA